MRSAGEYSVGGLENLAAKDLFADVKGQDFDISFVIIKSIRSKSLAKLSYKSCTCVNYKYLQELPMIR